MTEHTLSEEEISEAVRLLARLRPGFLPYPIFEQVARLMTLSILEIVPLRWSKQGGVEVLLAERSQHDPIFAGTVHTPGTVVTATDEGGPGGTWTAFERVLSADLKDVNVGDPHFVENILHRSKRGTEQAQMYWVEVYGEPKNGKFYSVGSLPSNLIESQREFIMHAAKHFEANRSIQP